VEEEEHTITGLRLFTFLLCLFVFARFDFASVFIFIYCAHVSISRAMWVRETAKERGKERGGTSTLFVV